MNNDDPIGRVGIDVSVTPKGLPNPDTKQQSGIFQRFYEALRPSVRQKRDQAERLLEAKVNLEQEKARGEKLKNDREELRLIEDALNLREKRRREIDITAQSSVVGGTDTSEIDAKLAELRNRWVELESEGATVTLWRIEPQDLGSEAKHEKSEPPKQSE